MIGRVVVIALGATVGAGVAAVLGYRGYDAFLRWLVAGTGDSSENRGTS
jgi:hypothetical protein